jgi:hypothetical protein
MRMRDPFGSFHFGRLAFGNLARILESLTSTPLAHKKCMFWTVMRSALGESTHTCERFLSYRIVVATLCHIILRKCRPLVASRLEPTQSLISTPPTVQHKNEKNNLPRFFSFFPIFVVWGKRLKEEKRFPKNSRNSEGAWR